eukprot:GHVU01120954.1.p1 GENE.GHVU01120954.1~~GHVU01120954.1.p1  ORF type:complete len:599 (+),score=102.10 GHVU01120954.1:73-1869(+)
MFLRKLLGTSDVKSETKNPTPPGMQTMGPALQRKFAKGVQYNMKIIIKGDRNVGKTCLFYRLQGQKFKEEYIPTDEIQVTSIQWNYKATDDVVKVEVWDVVDKGRKKKRVDGLKLDNSSEVFEDPRLDAEFINVYKGTHGVIMLLDITKQWTFDYIERELPKVPNHIPVLVLSNHRDMGHHRTVSDDKVRYFLDELSRPEGSGQVRYAETSMRNGYGLKYIHKFFNLPFLQLQRETLMQQLETNTHEINTTIQELDLHEESEEHDYDLFLENLTSSRRDLQDKLGEGALKEDSGKKEVQSNGPTSLPTTPMGPPPTIGLKEAPPAQPIPGLQISAPVRKQSNPSINQTSVSAPATPATTPGEPDQKQAGFFSRMFGSKNKEEKPPVAEEICVIPEHPAPGVPHVKSVDDFCPDEALDDSFLEDAKDTLSKAVQRTQLYSTDSDDETAVNPMVAGFQEELDDEDVPVAKEVPMVAKDIDLSSDDNDTSPHLAVKNHVDLDSDDENYRRSKTSKRQTLASLTVNSGKNSKNGKKLAQNNSSNSLNNKNTSADSVQQQNYSRSSNNNTNSNHGNGLQKSSSFQQPLSSSSSALTTSSFNEQ